MDGVNAELKPFVLMTYPVAKNVLNNYDLNVWRASRITSMDFFEHVRKSDKVHAGALCLADFKLCFIARRQNETTDELSIKSTGLGRIAVPNNLRQAEVFDQAPGATMKLGYFIMPVHPQGRICAETIQEDREAFILADKLGYSEAFCGEHLTDAVENIPSSLMFVASLADSTKTITLGSAVANLPHSHPVLIASHAAMVDHLLRGRFILGIGAGILRSDAEVLGILEQDRTAMLIESIEHIVALWQGSAPYNLTGKYWNISTAKTQWREIGLGGVLVPYQRPHPPLLGTASDPNSQTMTRIGKKGWLPTSSGFLHPNWLKNHWRNYSSGCASESRVPVSGDWRIARSIFVANDNKVAEAYGRRDSHSPYRFHMKQLSTKLAKSPAGLRGFKADEAMRDEDVTLDYIMDNIVIAGSPNSVVDQILAMHERTGDFGTLLCVGTDWSDKDLARASMTLMAEKVMPAVNAALPRQTARRAIAGQQAN